MKKTKRKKSRLRIIYVCKTFGCYSITTTTPSIKKKQEEEKKGKSQE